MSVTFAIKIQNSYADVTVTGTQYVGGISGQMQSANWSDFQLPCQGECHKDREWHWWSRRNSRNPRPGVQDLQQLFPCLGFRSFQSGFPCGEHRDFSSFIVNSYGTGSVGGSGTKKGISGGVSGSTLTNNFWDTETTGQAVDTSQGAGLPTASMKVACAPSSTTGICALGSAFVFTQGSYPKIKKCTSGCNTGSPTLSNDLVIGQD